MAKMLFVEKPTKIVVIAGCARSGKSKVAQFLKKFFEQSGKKVVVSPFSKYLKMFAKDVFGSYRDNANKPRDFLQQVGVELIQKKLGKQNFLINRQIDDIEIYSHFFDWIIIPDARFEHEIDALKQNFAHVWCVKVVSNKQNNLSTSQKNHATESAVAQISQSKFDFVVENNLGINNLQQKVQSIFKQLI